MSLPYPSMVFVPLDILTAEEMNQLVSNIESLSSGTGLADGAITSDKIDSATFYYESPTQTISSISSLESITVRLADIIPNYSTIVANNIIVGAFVVFTGGGTGAATYKMQGIGGSLDQQNYGFVLNNNLEQALGPWYYKVILTLLKKQSS